MQAPAVGMCAAYIIMRMRILVKIATSPLACAAFGLCRLVDSVQAEPPMGHSHRQHVAVNIPQVPSVWWPLGLWRHQGEVRGCAANGAHNINRMLVPQVVHNHEHAIQWQVAQPLGMMVTACW